ncbi:MAG: hypothetical protein OHK0022_33430 [Roseiflexaceae bacterium]
MQDETLNPQLPDPTSQAPGLELDQQASSLKPQASNLEQQASSFKPQASSLVYEVFSRLKEGGPMVHAGSVTADSPDLALIYAREVYGRRGESLALWVAPRDAFQMLEDSDMLHPALDRSYRMVEGYRMREKLKGLKAED